MNNKSYVNGKKVEDKNVKMVLNKGVLNVNINNNGKKKHYHILNNLDSSYHDLENRLKIDFMRENQEQLNFSHFPFQETEIIILPKQQLKKTMHNKKKFKKSIKRKNKSIKRKNKHSL
jgi:hypothetical protein